MPTPPRRRRRTFTQENEQWSNIPIPDPSVITEQRIAAVSTTLRAEFDDKLEAQADLLRTAGVGRHEKALLRIDAIEDILKLREELFNQKLHTIDVQVADFHSYAGAMRVAAEKYAEAMRVNADKNIDAAFSAAEKVNSNQRHAFEQQIATAAAAITRDINRQETLLDATKDAFAVEIKSLTGRMDRGEGGDKGKQETVDDRRAAVNQNTVILTCVSGFVLIFLAVVGVGISLHQSTPPVSAIGIDSKRLDDFQVQVIELFRQSNARMDTLSARLNTQLAPPPTQGPR